jgi:hypothetical protein
VADGTESNPHILRTKAGDYLDLDNLPNESIVISSEMLILIRNRMFKLETDSAAQTDSAPRPAKKRKTGGSSGPASSASVGSSAGSGGSGPISQAKLKMLQKKLDTGSPGQSRAVPFTGLIRMLLSYCVSASIMASGIKNALKGIKFHESYDQTGTCTNISAAPVPGRNKSHERCAADRTITHTDYMTLAEFEAVFGSHGTLLQPTAQNKPKSKVSR